jgi:hypothetical protein
MFKTLACFLSHNISRLYIFEIIVARRANNILVQPPGMGAILEFSAPCAGLAIPCAIWKNSDMDNIQPEAKVHKKSCFLHPDINVFAKNNNSSRKFMIINKKN